MKLDRPIHALKFLLIDLFVDTPDLNAILEIFRLCLHEIESLLPKIFLRRWIYHLGKGRSLLNDIVEQLGVITFELFVLANPGLLKWHIAHH